MSLQAVLLLLLFPEGKIKRYRTPTNLDFSDPDMIGIVHQAG